MLFLQITEIETLGMLFREMSLLVRLRERDYMTVDVYDSVEKMKSQGKQMPEKIRNEMNKKYGNGNSQREIMKRVMTTLI